MKDIIVFGGSGGLGSKVVPILKADPEFNLLSLSSKDIDVSSFAKTRTFFKENNADIIVNFSGLNFDSKLHKFEDAEKIQDMIDVNLKGTVNILVNSLPQMRKKSYGRIILISSVLTKTPVIGTSIYSACKSFIDTLARNCAIENARYGITCNSVRLGYFDGGLTYKIPKEYRDKILNKIPTKRWGKIDELVGVIRFLIETEYVNGANLDVDGAICP